MTTQGDNSTDDYVGFGLSIVAIAAGLVMFFGWELFGNEMLMKIIAIPVLLFGISGMGIEITNQTGEKSATDLGIGLGIIVTGILIGGINFPFSLNILILILVSFGAIFVITSIFSLAKNENPDLSFVYRLIIILGQICGALLAVIEFIQIFID